MNTANALEATELRRCPKLSGTRLVLIARMFRVGTLTRELSVCCEARSADRGRKFGSHGFYNSLSALLRWRFASRLEADPAASPVYASGHYIVMRVAVGLMLMVAGVSKVTTAQPMLIAAAWVIPGGVAAGWGAIEVALGWVALSFVAFRPLRLCLAFLFSFFSVLLLIDWSKGATECQCFGAAGIPILGMIGLDLSIVACLIIQRRWWDQPSQMPSGILGDLANHARIVLPALLAVSVFAFSSPRSALDYLSGKSVLVRSQHQFAGQVQPEATATAVFELRNVSSEPVRVVGAMASCRCVAIDDLPITLGPGERKPIRIRLIAGHAPGLQRESAELLFDDSTSSITLGVTALVHPNR